MKGRKIAFVGSGFYKNRKFVLEILKNEVNKQIDIVVSGHSPRNKYDNVDIWAEIWAKNKCQKKPIIHPPKKLTEAEFFARNKLISDELTIGTDILIGFINNKQYKSGTWNTIKHFVKKGAKYGTDWFLYDENGNHWEIKDIPKRYR